MVAVVGPTATGKSDLALELALRCGGEVVNADAMQLYRGLDVGTAKLAPDARRGVRHRQLDVLEVTETASVAAYQRHARADVEALRASGRTPVLVGGSGLYVQAVVDELEFPGTDPELRARLEAELASVGSQALHRRLAERDPAAAADVLASNGRRIVRALEVIALTGRPFRARMPAAAVPRYDAVLIGVDRDTAVLDERIAVRVQAMLAAGMVAETRELLGRGLRGGRTAPRALGYRQVLDALDEAGSDDADLTPEALERVREETVRATRRFVRRQRSWFRRDTRIHWLDGAAPDLLEQALDAVHAVAGRGAGRS
ncbi:tRNA (adenosine(37)-N6)-dimethylallyltransferase MiaA [Pseudonocardia sp. KRD291]|uniref:tRNA (adenosine(37)-N6)-dimethylallyltransferase MiaA n=1 Tax=Pseudonocardia sp. KRD291 TaxID=2792007 RepID=UPI001CF7A613|nr:tRNA (adenosine(37)-N6)-dimethylallyltransferase MiaA [Pseudonocardia sp. KRD291]